MVLLTSGLLCLAASARAVTWLTTQGARIGGAAVVASARIEQLRAACAGAGAGQATSGVFTERWTVAASGPLRSVTLNVSFPDPRGPRGAAFAAVLWCAPASP